jgi:hypothetical protein
MKKFLKEVTKLLITENEYDIVNLDIPYITSVLHQNLNNEKYSDFINDIMTNNYDLYYAEDETQGWTNGVLTVSISDKNDEDKELCTYTIEFKMEQRHWGYCECTPEDKDYRGDKDCCGHGCDWTAPAFEIKKIIFIGKDSWHGDQHDYWDFEDNFYKTNEELEKEKLKKDKETRIEELHNAIKEMQEELLKLKYEGE